MHPTIQMAKTEPYFCDFCITLHNDLDCLQADDRRHDCLLRLLARHREGVGKEHGVYRHHLANSKNFYDGSVQHMVFDYAEKIFFARPVR